MCPEKCEASVQFDDIDKIIHEPGRLMIDHRVRARLGVERLGAFCRNMR